MFSFVTVGRQMNHSNVIKLLQYPIWEKFMQHRLAHIAFNTLRDNDDVPDKKSKITSSRKRKSKNPAETAHSNELLIQCKRPEFNCLKSTTCFNPESEKLTSYAWANRKSNGDYFTIHPKTKQVQPEGGGSFVDMGLDSRILTWLKKNNFENPTEIEKLAMEPIIRGKNVLLAAETGCGKTLAYLLPLITQLMDWEPHMSQIENCPLSLIITPSRELAIQIADVAKSLAEELNLKSDILLGGGIRNKMLYTTFKKIDILVATFGALSKLTTCKVYNLSQVHHVVLDEADTLLDDSFNEHVKHFLRKIPFQFDCDRQLGKRPYGAQLTLASATMPKDIGPILEGVVAEESVVKLSTAKLHQLLPSISQKFMRIGRRHRPEELLKIVKQAVSSGKPTIIFSNKSSTCDWISMFLNESGIACVNFNSNIHRYIREGKFQQFQDGIVNVLSTTDIGSRGLDTTRAQVVVNFDFPVYMADYIHRCGRLGRVRSGKDGKVINFVTGPMEAKLVQAIETAARNNLPLPNVNANITKIIVNKITHRANRELKKFNR